MKKTKYYTCEYCYIEYVPKRRGVQKYCSNSCRSNACRVRNQKSTTAIKNDSITPLNESSLPKEQMSIAGVGNVVAGSFIANTLKTVFTKEDNKPVTKGDLKALSEKLQGRYHFVKNLQQLEDGSYPYFDLEGNVIVYLNPHNRID